ncbi:MAG: acetyltransferase [Vulcanimicrobiota bacterium]
MGEEILLIGGGGHCKSVIDIIEAQGIYEIKGIIDVKEKVGTFVLGYPIIAIDDEIKKLAQQHINFVIAIGQIRSPVRRKELFQKVKACGGKFPVIVSPNAYVSKHAFIGEGSVIMHQAVINASAFVGVNCIINTGAIVERDAVIGDNCHIAPGAIVNGEVKIGNDTFFGSGAVSRQSVTVKDGSFIKAHSLVKVDNE